MRKIHRYCVVREDELMVVLSLAKTGAEEPDFLEDEDQRIIESVEGSLGQSGCYVAVRTEDFNISGPFRTVTEAESWIDQSSHLGSFYVAQVEKAGEI